MKVTWRGWGSEGRGGGNFNMKVMIGSKPVASKWHHAMHATAHRRHKGNAWQAGTQ